MPEDNPNLEIKADLDVTKLVANARRALEGILDLSQGGTAALEGLAIEGEVATTVFEGMLGPLGPLLIAITQLSAAAIPLIENWQEQNDKLDDATTKTDDYAAAIANLAGNVDDYKTAADEAVQAITDAETAQEEAFANSNKVFEGRVALMQNAVDLQQKLTDAQLDASKAQEIAANKDGPEGIQRINAKYDALKEGYKERAGGEKLQNEKSALIYKNQAIDDESQREKDNRAKLQGELAKQTDAENKAKAAAAKAGLPTDKDAAFYAATAKAQQQKLPDLMKAELTAQKVLTGDGSFFNPSGLLGNPIGLDPAAYKKRAEDIKDAQEKLKAIQDEIADASQKGSAAEQLAKTSAATDNGKGSKDLKAALDASAIKIQALEDQEKDNNTKIEQLDIQIQTANLQDQNTQQALALKQYEGRLKLRNTDYDAENSAKINQAEIDATNPNLSPQQRAEATKREGELRAQEDERKIVEGTPLNTFETKIPGREQEFQLWLAQKKALGAISPNDNGNDQDYRGAFLNHEDPDSPKYAKPNSKNFTDQSIYATGPWARYAGKTQADGTVMPPEEKFPGIDVEHPLTQGQIDELYSHVRRNRSSGDHNADRPVRRREGDTGSIDNAQKAVADSGGSPQQIQQASAAVQELAQGHAEGASQLATILSELHDTVKDLSQAQRERDASLINKLKNIAAELNHTRAVAYSTSNAVQGIST